MTKTGSKETRYYKKYNKPNVLTHQNNYNTHFGETP